MLPTNTPPNKVHLLLYKSILWRGLFFATSFLLNILFARFYQASASGEIFYAITYYSLLIQVLGFSLESGLAFYAAKNVIPTSKLIGLSFVLTTIMGLAVTIFFSLYTPYSLRGIVKQFGILSATAFICGNILIAYSSNIFYAYRNFHTPNIISIGINVVLIVFLLIQGQPSGIHRDVFVFAFFYSYLVQGLVILAALAIGYRDGNSLSLPTIVDLQRIWRYSLQACISNVIFFILYRIDYWFVQKFCSANELGNYIQASKLAQLFFTLPGIMANVVFSLTAGNMKTEVNNNLKGIALILLLTSGIGCVFLAITGHWLFPFVYGESFTKIYVPFLLLIPGILSLSALYPYAAYYSGMNRIDINIKGSLLALVVIVAGDITLIPRYGIAGAALVSSLGYFCYHVYVLLIYKKEQQLTIPMLVGIGVAELRWVRQFIAPKTDKETA
jgi:O-antigen/teichoic acid export membrane protein